MFPLVNCELTANMCCVKMADVCSACGVEHKREKYRLRDTFGKTMQLGREVKDLLGEDLCENTANTVFSKYRYALIRLEKLKGEYEALGSKLKKQLVNQCIQPKRGHQAPAVQYRSPSAQSTRISPAPTHERVLSLKDSLNCL